MDEKSGGHITKFLPAVIDFSGGQVNTKNGEKMDELINILNGYVDTFGRYGFKIDWHYVDMNQALDGDQLSVDIVLSDKIGVKQEAIDFFNSGRRLLDAIVCAGNTPKNSVIFTVEKNNAQMLEAEFLAAIKKLWGF